MGVADARWRRRRVRACMHAVGAHVPPKSSAEGSLMRRRASRSTTNTIDMLNSSGAAWIACVMSATAHEGDPIATTRPERTMVHPTDARNPAITGKGMYSTRAAARYL